MKHHAAERQESRFSVIKQISNYDPRLNEPWSGPQRAVAAIALILLGGVLAGVLGIS